MPHTPGGRKRPAEYAKGSCIIQNLLTGGKMLETECHRWMADALPKQGGNLGAPDMKSVSVGAWKVLSAKSEGMNELAAEGGWLFSAIG